MIKENNKRTHILFIALIVVIVFSPSLKNDFAWDDRYLILNNSYIKDFSYLPTIFKSQLYEGGDMKSNFYRPLQLISFAIDYHIWKSNPFGYHLSSLMLHIFNSALVYLIAFSVALSPFVAFVTSILFSIAPAISGTTYYIPARSDLLMAFFMFLSILFFIRYREEDEKILHISSILSFALSLLCKEMAIMMPLLLLLIISKPVGDGLKPSPTLRGNVFRPLVPYLAVLLVYFALRLTVLNFAGTKNPLTSESFPVTIPLIRRILTDFKIILLYLRILLFPAGLHMDWFVEPARSISQVDILLSIALVIFISFFIRKISNRNNIVLFGALWFLLSLSPVLNVLPISVFFGEGWLYVPSVGFFIALAVVSQDIIKPLIGKRITLILIALLLLYYGFFTMAYGKVWKDSISLFSNILKYEKQSPFIYLTYNNMAVVYGDKREFKKAIESCKKSIALNPDYAGPYNNLGIIYTTLGKPVKAIRFFKKAIEIKKDYAHSYSNLGHAYALLGLKERALEFSRLAISIDPNAYKAYCNLGHIYAEKGDLDKSLESFKKAIEIKSDHYEPHYCLGAIYVKKEDYKKALDEYNKALSLGMEGFKLYNSKAFVYLKMKRFKESENALLLSLALNGKQFEAHNELGNLYSMFGHFDLAIKEYKLALKAAPNNKGIHENIKRIHRNRK